METKTSEDKLDGTKAVFRFEEIPEPSCTSGNATRVQFGRPIPPQLQVLIYSPAEWEDLIEEWVHSQKTKYVSVVRLTGANDMGIDIAGFTDEQGIMGVWDNFQCKHYSNALTPKTAAVEVAKILWYSFQEQYVPPREYHFIAPKGCGIALTKLISNPSSLQDYVIKNWDKQCAREVTAKQAIMLEGTFKAYVETFDFSIFKSRKLLDILDEHRLTSYHAIRFGGGLPDRPAVVAPPSEPDATESRYIQQLFEAYSDHAKTSFADLTQLGVRRDLVDHFQRQREFFYHAESLRNFARDTVPPGTFEDLQSEVYAGVVDVENAAHQDGYARLNAVTQAATQIQLTSNALISVTKVHDRKGICHQLANEDRLRWRKP